MTSVMNPPVYYSGLTSSSTNESSQQEHPPVQQLQPQAGLNSHSSHSPHHFLHHRDNPFSRMFSASADHEAYEPGINDAGVSGIPGPSSTSPRATSTTPLPELRKIPMHSVYKPGENDTRSTKYLHKQKRGTDVPPKNYKAINGPCFSGTITSDNLFGQMATTENTSSNGYNLSDLHHHSASTPSLASLVQSSMKPDLANAAAPKSTPLLPSQKTFILPPTPLESPKETSKSLESALPESASGQPVDPLAPSTALPKTEEAAIPDSSISPITSDSDSSTRSPLIRKKSGELVKSSLKLPGLVRAKSLPSTKMVHFDTNLVRVRRFQRTERPAAVSADSSPQDEKVVFQWVDSDEESETDSDEEVKVEWSIDLPNFHKEANGPSLGPSSFNSERVVYLDKVFLSSDKTNLVGHVWVKNISFQKQVAIRFSIDYWQSVTEIMAEYNGQDVRCRERKNGYDRFTFVIKLVDLPMHALMTKSMFFCIRYRANGMEFWDNNGFLNYEVIFKRQPKSVHGESHGKKSLTNGSRLFSQVYHHRRSKTEPQFKDSDFDSDFSGDERHEYDHDSSLNTSPALRPVETLPSSSNGSSINYNNSNGNKKDILKSRYNFGDSLNQLHDQNKDRFHLNLPKTLFHREESSSSKGSGKGISPTTSSIEHISAPETASASQGLNFARPSLDSSFYQDLISKYCFFEPASTSPKKSLKETGQSQSKTGSSPPQLSIGTLSPRPIMDSGDEEANKALDRLNIKENHA